MNAKHTPGPWRWEICTKYRNLKLAGGVPNYDLTVMDFVRWGMSNASVRLRDDVANMNIMHRIEKWAKPAPGREHHAEWFQEIHHPDAMIIAAAPDMLAALEAVVETCRKIDGGVGPSFESPLAMAKRAIAKAKGEAA